MLLPIRKPGELPSPVVQQLERSLAELGIGMVIPPEAEFEGAKVTSESGILLQGKFTGTMICARSVVIADGAWFCGRIEAEDIYIEGRVGNAQKAAADSALILARRSIMLGRQADVQAVLKAPHMGNYMAVQMHSSQIIVMGSGAWSGKA